MEEHLFNSLHLPERKASVLDAGCGHGYVAINLARRGQMNVVGIDVIDRHLARAQANVVAAGLGDQAVTVRKADYHHLDKVFAPESFDGVYTMETFVHATDPRAALAGFLRVLRPGGTIALYEYDHAKITGDAPREMASMFEQVNRHAAMPANVTFEQGALPALMRDVGFEQVTVTDLSENVMPMMRLFFVCAYIPYLIIRLFGLEAYFINTVAAIVGYRYRRLHRYIALSAKKPAEKGTSQQRIKESSIALEAA
jgi:ubiquinone/menaquinone biosynthesis C-methylase UbiE